MLALGSPPRSAHVIDCKVEESVKYMAWISFLMIWNRCLLTPTKYSSFQHELKCNNIKMLFNIPEEILNKACNWKDQKEQTFHVVITKLFVRA